jgi:hypothetical protein
MWGETIFPAVHAIVVLFRLSPQFETILIAPALEQLEGLTTPIIKEMMLRMRDEQALEP